jgi:predicted DsbA family dithiol-disulfide isomerase
MRVDIWSDLVCPWCYLGKRRFERALAGFAHRDEVEVVHRSFQLDPSMPKGKPVDQLKLLMSKYGMGEAQARAQEERLEQLAAQDGLEYHLLGNLIGNTVDAHRLVHLAKDRGIADQVVERLYRAHFTEQRSIFDNGSLVGLAEEAGLDKAEAGRVLADGTYTDAVEADGQEAQALGATGVPFFVIDNRYGISGAQPTELFTEALTRAWADAHPVLNLATASDEACADGSCAVPTAAAAENRD